MTTASQSTVGSTVYVVDRTVSPAVVVAIAALKGFSAGGGGKRKKIDKSNMDSKKSNEYAGGRIDPNEASGEIILMKSNAGHQSVKKIFEAGAAGSLDNIEIYVGDGDGTAPPTLVSDVLTPPKSASPIKWTRTGTLGKGYISTFMPKKVDDDVDRADFAFQWSGDQTWQVKGEVIANTY